MIHIYLSKHFINSIFNKIIRSKCGIKCGSGCGIKCGNIEFSIEYKKISDAAPRSGLHSTYYGAFRAASRCTACAERQRAAEAPNHPNHPL